MTDALQLIEEGRKDELWKKHCGFLSLSIGDFMDIQKRLMLEQIKLLGTSKIGKHLMGAKTPSSIEEFRRVTPLTDYSDYSNFLTNKNEEDLPVKPYVWARTSGRSSDLGPKWIPYTPAFYQHLGDPIIAGMLMCSSTQEGDVRIERNDKFLMSSAPRPYAGGYIARSIAETLNVIYLPDLDAAEKMSFGERVTEGFKLAMRQGLDYFAGMSIVLARMGEQFETQTNNAKPSKDLLNLPTLFRLIRAVIIAKVNRRNILPKDIWKLKGIMSGGADTGIYMDRIEYYWGRKPLEGFSCTEGGNLAMQSWNYKGMTFFPDAAFLEFIPLSEVNLNKEDPTYQPKTVLLDELETGIYELVISNFHGGIFTRYRMFDLFKVLSIGDKQIGTVLPQVQFYSRADDIIDIGSYLRLTERDIWMTIDGSGLKYSEWSANKEIIDGNSTIHLYIEFKEPPTESNDEILRVLDEHFSKRFQEYRDIKNDLGINPLKFTLLPSGSFNAYIRSKLEAGADLAHLKPPHMRPSAASLSHLLTILQNK